MSTLKKDLCHSSQRLFNRLTNSTNETRSCGSCDVEKKQFRCEGLIMTAEQPPVHHRWFTLYLLTYLIHYVLILFAYLFTYYYFYFVLFYFIFVYFILYLGRAVFRALWRPVSHLSSPSFHTLRKVKPRFWRPQNKIKNQTTNQLYWHDTLKSTSTETVPQKQINKPNNTMNQKLTSTNMMKKADTIPQSQKHQHKDRTMWSGCQVEFVINIILRNVINEWNHFWFKTIQYSYLKTLYILIYISLCTWSLTVRQTERETDGRIDGWMDR